MKLTIEDGRDSFYTFDTNRILLLTATDEEQINQVEFSTEENGETVSWTSDVLTGEDGIKYVQVPNEFLNGNYSRLVCYYVALDSKGEYTRQKEVFRIRARQEPEDYFLTYSERITFASIKALTEQYKVNASNSADLARRYSEEDEDVNVETGTYSSKHWSAKSEKKFQEIKDYVGSTSDPESALGSIESARASAVSDVNKQKADSIKAVGTYTSNTAIPSVSQYVESTEKPALKTYGEQQVDSYVSGTSKPELDRYVNNEKKQVLDNYTAEKKSDLDNYTETDKKQVLDSYTENEKKAELDSHTEGLKEQLNAQTVAKTGELNEYTTGLKSELDGYTTAKEQDISEFTEQKKLEVQGVYQTDLDELKGDLEAERNARIEADTDHSTRLQKVELSSSVNRYEINNLKAKAEGKLYRTEIVEAEAYALDVPSSVAPYAEVQKIRGKSVVWNQLVDPISTNINGVTLTVSKGTWTLSGTATSSGGRTTNISSKYINLKSGHKYVALVENNNNVQIYISNKEDSEIITSIMKSSIFILGSSYTQTILGLNVEKDKKYTRKLKINIFDLTQMFGSGNEPTLEECNKIFSANYYPYDAGTIKSFPVRTVKSVKKNLCLAKDVYAGAYEYLETTLDGRDCIRFASGLAVTNKPIIFNENTQYTVSFDLKMIEKVSDGGVENVFTFYYTDGSNSTVNANKANFTDWARVSKTSDSNKTILSIGLMALDYRTYSYVSNFQLEKGSIATDYTPYKETMLDVSSVTSDLKSVGSVHDEWSDGKKIIRVGERAYTSGDESESGYITDGTTTYYPLDTPTEETVSEIDNYINVEGSGTLTFESDDAVHMPVPSTDRFVVDLTSTTEETT